MTRDRPIITLLTDFGEGSPYVAAMKGVILTVCPQVTIVDLSHSVPPQAVEEGAFILAATVPTFPSSTIHVCVVDPGVGTDRRAIAIRAGGATFIGPDNGLLSPAIADAHRPTGDGGGPTQFPIGGLAEAVALTRPQFHRLPVSPTFHGRDIFAPVAAHLANGSPLAEVGEPIPTMMAFAAWRAIRQDPSGLKGRVISIDRFGNCITTIHETDLHDLGHGHLVVAFGGQDVAYGVQRTYQDGREYLAYIGSAGYLELARRNGDAASSLNIRRGDIVAVRQA